MTAYLCTACGTEYPSSEKPPSVCIICEEERQYVPVGGQKWTTVETLALTHQNTYRQYEPGLIGIGTTPAFAIGQRALVLQTPQGNILWDCISLIDDATVTIINSLGGLSAIAISHPHFYTTMGRWSSAFSEAPIYLHADDKEWVQSPVNSIKYWSGDTEEILPGITLVRCGGHFPGANILHWTKGAGGTGLICSGDTLTVTLDHKFLSFMRSYPNFIPLSEKEITKIDSALKPISYERIYGHYFDRVIDKDAKTVMKNSVARYIAAIEN